MKIFDKCQVKFQIAFLTVISESESDDFWFLYTRQEYVNDGDISSCKLQFVQITSSAWKKCTLKVTKLIL